MKTVTHPRTVISESSKKDESFRIGTGEQLTYIFFADQENGAKKDVPRKLDFHLHGRGAVARVFGFNIGSSGFSDIALQFLHEGPDTTGQCRMKSAVAGDAESAVRGMIRIDEKASGTDGQFTHNALLLSDTASVLTIPGLEIKTNDVKASHAATVSHLDADTLFYLQSRGLPTDEARSLVVTSFLHEYVHEITDDAAREQVTDAITKRVAQLI